MINISQKIKASALKRLFGKPVVYHHVPKCGGTSVERALRRRYALSYATFPLPAIYNAVQALHPNYNSAELDDESSRFREVQLLSLLYQNVYCVAGHVYFSKAAHGIFSGNYTFATTIREPVAFFRSFYVQLRSAREARWKITTNFDDFLETELAEQIGKFYLIYFSRLSRTGKQNSSIYLGEAMQNLAGFDVVGLLEDMPAFERRLADSIGVGVRFGHTNRGETKGVEEDLEITPERKRKIEILSEANIAIYQFVKRELAS